MHHAPWWFETLSPLILSILQWDNDRIPDHNLDLFGLILLEEYWLMYWLTHRAPWWFETLSPLILSILQWDNDSVPDHNLGWFVCQLLCMFLLVFGIPYTFWFPKQLYCVLRRATQLTTSSHPLRCLLRSWVLRWCTALTFNNPNPHVMVCLKDVIKAS